jgi:hypothetical protein
VKNTEWKGVRQVRNNEAITIERMGKGFMISSLEGEIEHIPCETKKNLFKVLDRHFSERRENRAGKDLGFAIVGEQPGDR